MIRINLHRADGRGIAPLPGWATALITVGALAAGVVLFLLAASLALILVPVALIGGAVAAWRIRKTLRKAGIDPAAPFARRPAPDGIIDAEYRVIEEPRERR